MPVEKSSEAPSCRKFRLSSRLRVSRILTVVLFDAEYVAVKINADDTAVVKLKLCWWDIAGDNNQVRKPSIASYHFITVPTGVNANVEYPNRQRPSNSGLCQVQSDFEGRRFKLGAMSIAIRRKLSVNETKMQNWLSQGKGRI